MIALWMPILLSAVFVFIASSLLHMVLPWHKGDQKRLPDEDKLLAALRPFNLPPGDYMAPRCEKQEEMKTEAFAEKMRTGPVFLMTVIKPGPFAMGRFLLQWFGYLLVVCYLTSYAARLALPAHAAYRPVFHLTMVISFLAYAVAGWPESIWFQRSWATTLRNTIDALIYSALTAGTFAWLWPR